MFHITNRTGTPFDITDNKVFIKLPSNVRLTGALKKNINTNYTTFPREAIEHILSEYFFIGGFDGEIEDEFEYFLSEHLKGGDPSFDTNSISELNRKINHEISTDIEFIINYLGNSKNKKAVNNVIRHFNPGYQEEMVNFIENHGSHPISIKLTSYSVNYILEQLSLLSGDYKRAITHTVCDKLNELLNESQRDTIKTLDMLIDEHLHETNLDSGILMSKISARVCVLSMSDSSKVEGAVKAFWSICDAFAVLPVFGYFYGKHQFDITRKQFPFLLHGSLKYFYDTLVKSDYLEFVGEQTENNENSDVIGQIEEILEDESIDEKETVLRVKAYCDFHTGVEIIESYERYHQTICFTLNRINDSFEDLPFTCPAIITPNTSPRLRKKEFRAAYNKIKWIHDAFLQKDIDNIQNEWKEISPLTDSLNNEATELSKDALNNLTRLGDIKAELEVIDGERQAKEQVIADLQINLITSIQSLVDEYYSTVFSEDKSTGDKLDDLTTQVELLESELDDANTRCQNSNVELKKTKAELQTFKNNYNQPTKIPADSPKLTLDDIRPLLTSGEKLSDILPIIIKMSGDHVVLSDTCLKDLAKNNFDRTPAFFDKLSILLSTDFVNTYVNKGSQACFEFFTKVELSFRESKTTQNRKDLKRNFKFDGVQMECMSHLRFGVDAKEQHTLRVYFTIKNNKLYIGTITKHLETACVK